METCKDHSDCLVVFNCRCCPVCKLKAELADAYDRLKAELDDTYEEIENLQQKISELE